jgi:WD40 repeat protein
MTEAGLESILGTLNVVRQCEAICWLSGGQWALCRVALSGEVWDGVLELIEIPSLSSASDMSRNGQSFQPQPQQESKVQSTSSLHPQPSSLLPPSCWLRRCELFRSAALNAVCVLRGSKENVSQKHFMWLFTAGLSGCVYAMPCDLSTVFASAMRCPAHFGGTLWATDQSHTSHVIADWQKFATSVPEAKRSQCTVAPLFLLTASPRVPVTVLTALETPTLHHVLAGSWDGRVHVWDLYAEVTTSTAVTCDSLTFSGSLTSLPVCGVLMQRWTAHAGRVYALCAFERRRTSDSTEESDAVMILSAGEDPVEYIESRTTLAPTSSQNQMDVATALLSDPPLPPVNYHAHVTHIARRYERGGTIKLWTYRPKDPSFTPSLVTTLSFPFRVFCIALHPVQPLLVALGLEDESVQLYDLNSTHLNPLAVCRDFSGVIYDVNFAVAQPNWLAVACEDGTTAVLDITRKLQKVYSYTHCEAVRAVRWADDGSLTYLSVSWDGTFHLHSLAHLAKIITAPSSGNNTSHHPTISPQNSQRANNDNSLKVNATSLNTSPLQSNSKQ